MYNDLTYYAEMDNRNHKRKNKKEELVRQVHGNAFLDSVFKEGCILFKVNNRRTLNNVSVRAAFCKAMDDTKSFTLEQLGFAVKKDHATVLHAIRQANIGYYSDIIAYREALLFFCEKIAEKEGSLYAVPEPSDLPHATKKHETRLINMLKQENERLAGIVSEKNKEIAKDDAEKIKIKYRLENVMNSWLRCKYVIEDGMFSSPNITNEHTYVKYKEVLEKNIGLLLEKHSKNQKEN